jgi:predicted AAA+ superfamily ATPase
MVVESDRPFSRELLQDSTSTKLQYFRDIIVPHRNIRRILEELLKNAKEPDDALVYLVFGVTGSGKTRLKEELEKRLLKHFMDELVENPGSLIVGGDRSRQCRGRKV